MKYQFDWKKYASLARQMAAEGCVLVRNENHALPIKKGEKVSLFGRIQNHYYKSGTGSGGMVNAPYVVSIADGLEACEGITLNQELKRVYAVWEAENPFDEGTGWAGEPWCQKEMTVTEEVVKAAAACSELAVVVIGRTAGEDKDNSAVSGSYLLSGEEEQLLSVVCRTFDRVAVVLNVGNIIDMSWVERYQPQAVLYIWQGGMEGGNAAADVLSGKVNPCGRLADTIAADISDYPSSADFGDDDENIYKEDIYTGYRYFETVAKDKVIYPFGFGLSYTEFETKIVEFKETNGDFSLSVEVKNSGSCAGKEVVQVYLCPPQGVLGKPLRSLAAYGKTRELAPGEKEILEFSVKAYGYASFDEDGKTGNPSCYVLEHGTYLVYAGSNVREAEKAGEFVISETKVLERLCSALAPVKEYSRMKPASDENSGFYMTEETVPRRRIAPAQRKAEQVLTEVPYTGDLGFKLADVKAGKVDMVTFLSQLSNKDLICISRGEGMNSPKVTPGTAAAFGGVTERLLGFGIPAACCTDGPSGLRMDCGTKAFSLPSGTCIACSFNTELACELYEMQGLEMRKNKIDILLAPGMNLHRNPLNGRNFEYFSEDPYLTGKMAEAEIKGLGHYGVTGSLKHFAGNNQEHRRHFVNGVVSERALRELYLKGFEIAVKEGGAYCVMSTYGPVNGIWTAGSFDLITHILRGEWGFQGLVMTDWWAKINDEGQPGTIQNTAAMIGAQNDVYMVTENSEKNSNQDNTAEALAAGRISRNELARNAANICGVILRSPVMERICGEEEEWEVLNEVKTEGSEAEILQFAEVSGSELSLDVTGLSATRGSSGIYALNLPNRGDYEITFTMKSNAGELAQMPISVYWNNQLEGILTMNGTGGERIKKTLRVGTGVAIENYLKLYFGETGVVIEKLQIAKTEK